MFGVWSPVPRSTKAGVETPATRPHHGGRHRGLPRSTKAGVETPATQYLMAMSCSSRSALNEGRGRDPGDTRELQGPVRRDPYRSTKAGVETPATLVGTRSSHVALDRSTKAGSRPRRHAKAMALSASVEALNEGRGRDPGDTRTTPPQGLSSPRRSTKAGVETPATLLIDVRCLVAGAPLNEGRGRDPGDTTSSWRATSRTTSLNEGRGRDPGDTTSARQRSMWRTPSLNEGRGRDPGDTGQGGGRWGAWNALNEGRGRDPGDTRLHQLGGCPIHVAQRRPGSRPRRHACSSVAPPTLVSAQRRPGSRPGDTRHTPTLGSRGETPLNEGRGRDPGDTAEADATHTLVQVAQRRPGSRPRRH